MGRLSRAILAGAFVLLPALSQPAQAQDKVTFNGDIALWSFGIKPDQTANYERVLAKLKEALMKSELPEARKMAAGWRVMKGVVNPQTGNVIYTHVISPVVPGADYNITGIIYSVFKDPAEQKEIYDLYRTAFGAALGANVGTVVSDFSR
jgi:hypothetical protein